MMTPRFLQIHTLTSYTGALLNRDDSGLAKRLPYGGLLRTRVSSQCLKRHWRIAEDPHALRTIDGVTLSTRSRDLIDDRVIGDLRGRQPDEVLDALATWFNYAVYGGNDAKKPTKRGTAAPTDDKARRQTLLFGEPELRWLSEEVARLAGEAGDDPDRAFELGKAWQAEFKKNIETLRAGAQLPGGLAAALFGRMVTSDTDANITAPVHVAHAFTVHEEEAESDYFTAVDDLSGDEPGADTIQETELTSGLFYGYAVVDLPGLMDNLGASADREGAARLGGAVLHNLVHLIAEVSPGAKLGSTAPYGRAGVMLLEAGERQPRSLAEAFREPVAPHLGPATSALADHLQRLDDAYATGEERRALSLANVAIPGAETGSIKDLANWAGTLPERL